MFNEEEEIESDGLFDEEALEVSEEEEELGKKRPKSITILPDEDEIEIMKPVENTDTKSERLTMNSNGKLVKEKPKNSLMDLFKKAKERKAVEEDSGSEIEPEVIDVEKDSNGDRNDDHNGSLDGVPDGDAEVNPVDTENTKKIDGMLVEDENDYDDAVPTAEDYERYRRMMAENRSR